MRAPIIEERSISAKLSLKHPLSAPVESGLHNLERLGLKAEASMGVDIEAIQEFSGVLISAHAPATIGALRLNYGATDEDFRNRSIAHIIDYIERRDSTPTSGRSTCTPASGSG